MTVQSLLESAQSLSPREREQLIKALLDQRGQPAPEPLRQSMRVFRGQAATVDQDAQSRIDQLRAEWVDTRR